MYYSFPSPEDIDGMLSNSQKDNTMSDLRKRVSVLETMVTSLIKRLDECQKEARAQREYDRMERSRENYEPPYISERRCDFTSLGDELICTECHFPFRKINNYVPLYCPRCFAKREEM